MDNLKNIENLQEILKEYQTLKLKDEKHKKNLKKYYKDGVYYTSIIKNQKKYYDNPDNKKKILEKRKIYYEKNKEIIRERQNERAKNKREELKIKSKNELSPLNII